MNVVVYCSDRQIRYDQLKVIMGNIMDDGEEVTGRCLYADSHSLAFQAWTHVSESACQKVS